MNIILYTIGFKDGSVSNTPDNQTTEVVDRGNPHVLVGFWLPLNCHYLRLVLILYDVFNFLLLDIVENDVAGFTATDHVLTIWAHAEFGGA